MDIIEKWNQDAVDYQRVFLEGIHPYNRELMEFLMQSDMLRPGGRVLDIGCGVGKYGTYFAELGCDVTLTDISPEMLRYAEENMSAYQTPWRTLLCDFHEVSIAHPILRRGFDLSVSTMSPAICDLETVKKMSALTGGWCFLASFVGWSQPARDRFYASLGVVPEASMPGAAQKAAAFIRFVSAAGYVPLTKYVPYNWTDARTPEDAAALWLGRLTQAEQPPDDWMGRAVRAAEALANEQGMIDDAIETKVVWIYWKTTS